MSEDFTSQALRYLLDELEPGERAAFEVRLEREPAAAAAFKSCADSFGRFGLERGWVDRWPEAELEVGYTELKLRVAEAGLSPAAPRGRRRWRNYLWPFAAAIFLALNLWQWLRPGETEGGLGPGVAASGNATGKPRDAAARSNAGLGVVAAAPEDRSGAISLKVTDPRVAADLRRLEALRREYQALQKDRDALAKEYGQIVNQLIPNGVVETGAGRLVAMELVDQASYDSGDRNGLLMKAKALLTTPGLVAVPAPSASVGTAPAPSAATGSGAASKDSPVIAAGDTGTTPASTATAASSGTMVATTAATTAVTGTVESIGTVGLTSAGTLPGSVSTGATSIEGAVSSTATSSPSASNAASAPSAASTAPSSSASASTSAATESTAPYAWSVYDDTAHQGYLNLYNLPTVSAGSVLELWVMPAGSSQFQAVGQVPSQFYGQSGSLYYQLPAATATPSQVLITVESGAGTVPAVPSGAVVLRGP